MFFTESCHRIVQFTGFGHAPSFFFFLYENFRGMEIFHSGTKKTSCIYRDKHKECMIAIRPYIQIKRYRNHTNRWQRNKKQKKEWWDGQGKKEKKTINDWLFTNEQECKKKRIK
ncbi:uncharacterized protein BYT42DRAFT_13179 [Radiomyces spectabilis]|uniref:uncharacterized protein n=1 Tax=Radiomyces spectabilis TaxID=64574 RepID=UPI00221F09A3|nr:uncharacterized protein BYT42DRAFT_13179 [Radiomyces spectabilis]KAI8393616.1 hypothetical protein BYT42DRAFT_13179 [Radiomyces spectabilis]